MMLGQLPSGYSKAVHGPYDPAVFYGKRDVPLGQVGSLIRLNRGLYVHFLFALDRVNIDSLLKCVAWVATVSDV